MSATPSPSDDNAASPQRANQTPLIALLGNPNVGKTTLFNRLTGQNERVGNYPGITVERRVSRGALFDGSRVDFLDVPGIYSLAARSFEERVALDALLGWRGPKPDLVLLVVDATQLNRNLYLGLQILELGLPCVIALNMIDEVDGALPDLDQLSAMLGAPVVPISAQKRTNIDGLKRVLQFGLKGQTIPLDIAYPDALEADIARVVDAMPDTWRADPRWARGLAMWALNSIDASDEMDDIPDPVRQAVRAVQQDADAQQRDIDLEIIGARYAVLDDQPDLTRATDAARSWSDRVDGVLLHPFWGFGVFIALMLVIFQSLFAWADPAIGLIEAGIEWLAVAATTTLPPGLLADLIIEGLIGGVGNVVVFLPQILLLFFFIGLMEDSGYMARAAYLMDRVMQGMGLHGRAFVPMLSGFACAVPAVMATRTMERRRDRLLTMMVVPLMTCSARLPVYTLIIAALFPPSDAWGWVPVQGLLMMGMYVFSVAISLVAAFVLGRTVLKGKSVPLLMELPPLRSPTLVSVIRMMTSRARVFLTEAGTVILVCTVVLWGLLSFPQQPAPADDASPQTIAAHEAAQLERSYAGQFGKAIEPAIAPLGFDWKIGVGLVGSFAAREVFVSTMGLVYGVGGDVDEESLTLRDKMRAETRADGSPAYSPLVGMSLMIFFALACQCMSTLAVVKRETGGYRWPVFLFAYMTALAWVCSFVVYQGGRLLGL
ncbi:MAG: ferrous iron transport protein B [Myxococcota bacterium]